MPTTSNFGWTTPADTDLVKDGAAAIRTLGNGIDTSLVDLKGGTTGQLLSKASNTDLDFTWTAAPVAGGFTEIATGTLSGSEVSVTSIPTTYKSLVLRIYNYRPATDGDSLRIRLNADTGNNYNYTTATTATNVAAAVSVWSLNISTSDNGASNSFIECTIPNYASTATYKIASAIGLYNNETTPANIDYTRGQFIYFSNTAITSVQFRNNSGNFTSGTYFVYGVN